jgi:hypothetical protein
MSCGRSYVGLTAVTRDENADIRSVAISMSASPSACAGATTRLAKGLAHTCIPTAQS